ncbi:MAG: penicillin acylase family protein [Nocardioides sp.]
MRRTALAVIAVAALLAGAAGGGGAVAVTAAAPAVDDHGTVLNILPPGSNGNVTAADLAGVGPDRVADAENPENFADQLEIYDDLTTVAPGEITAENLGDFFKPAGFTPEEVVSTETPREGVTIERDTFGVPYITGDTFEDVEFGAGYAAVQDRMFLMDVLRHAGQARLAEFAGDTPGNVAMDRAQLASAYYTEEEATEQVEIAANRAGAGGDRLVAAVDSFIEGINAAQDALCPGGLPAAPECPAEYAALQKTPEPWTRADVVYVASLVGGIFGKGGGAEYENALWYARLVDKFGARKARQIYSDLREKNDPEAATTSSILTPYQGGAFRPGRPGAALPDLDGPTAPGSGDPTGDSAPVDEGAVARLDLPNASIDIPIDSNGMSNAILVGSKLSETGKPLAVMGPQTGYFTPQLLVEQVLNGPGIQARGVAFAGTNLFVQLGHGVDYAWSATSAGSDNVDTVVERLCNTDGSKPTVDSTAYRRGKKCVEMEQFTHTETTTPGAGSQEPPKTYEFQVLRTHHGLVQLRTTVKGKPVAIVKQRSTYGHEVDSVFGFSQLNDPGFVRNAADFQRATSNIDFTFNWFYADDRDISYYSSGLLPLRSPQVEPDLPRWGNARYDWKGWLPFDRHPRQTNPDSGYLVSWNNKQAPGFGASDAEWGYGAVYRSLALEERLRKQVRRDGDVDVAQLVGIMSGAATADSRASETLPWLLKAVGRDKSTAGARKLLSSWLRSGAQRVDRDRDGSYGHEQAIALFDTWWEDGRHGVAYDVMKGRLGAKLVRRLPRGIDDHPRLGRGSAWNGVAWYGYVSKELRTVLGARVEQPYRTSYCGRGDLGRCRATLRTSLAKAIDRILAEQGVESVQQLTYDKHEDDIRHTTAGVVGVRPIDWQNRPTFQQVVAYTSHRPRG